ncbi:malonyl-CoA decarboxylase [Alkalilacustris brevis]|uniref:malonyl-CoA decarboxylase n=1 Tax=Alkalilacustris brevis TaxID=2026338 RepID=UPI000E0D73FD|nr:malonyl-CoA decarboxylase [Alkalilacustris brevis]
MTRSSYLGDLLATLFERRAGLWRAQGGTPISELCQALLSGRGEVSGMRLAREVLAQYRLLDEKGRRDFFVMLARDMDLDPEAVREAAAAYADTRDRAGLARLVQAAEPARQELLRRLNQSPGATAELVRMRADLLRLMRDDPVLARADLDFAHLFGSWFNRGFLVLRRISWESPAKILEKIIEYEAVHAIDDWDDLRGRLEPPDRRCFAFFHPAMPDEPLIFVEVALVQGVSGSVQALLAEGREVLDPARADTAVFYSISNCQPGLRGVSFGNSLIKQVVEVLRGELPHLGNFLTLSPIPGLAAWLRERAGEEGDRTAAALLAAAERARDTLQAAPKRKPAKAKEALPAPPPAGALPEAAHDPLRALAAKYLLEARREDGQPRDPVARFHLGNGAQVYEIHAGADLSAKGLAQSCGAMVNYHYDPRTLETNHEAYVSDQRVAATRGVRALLKAKAEWKGPVLPAVEDKRAS